MYKETVFHAEEQFIFDVTMFPRFYGCSHDNCCVSFGSSMSGRNFELMGFTLCIFPPLHILRNK